MSKYPTINELRHKVTFQEPIKEEDEYGGNAINWQNVATVWASIEPISGREYFEAHQIQNEVSHRIKIRHMSNINEEMRIVYGERIFEIESIIDIDERRFYMEIICRESR